MWHAWKTREMGTEVKTFEDGRLGDRRVARYLHDFQRFLCFLDGLTTLFILHILKHDK
jgi:hypothetical protein